MASDSGGVGPVTDYYDLLGVEQSADRATIMQAYREQVKQYHPDVADRRDHDESTDAETSAYRFKHLSTAREILSNPARREEYDLLGHTEYLAKHADGDPIRPAASPESTTDAVTESDRTPAWYHTDNASARQSGQPASPSNGRPATEVDTGTVVEGDAETTIDDLVGRDPLEVAWQRFRLTWLARGVLLFGLVGFVLATGQGPLSPQGRWLSGGVVLAVLLTGEFSLSLTPRADEPTTPPPNASVGLLRPEMVDTYRRRATVLLGTTGVLTLFGLLTVGHPWLTAFGSSETAAWVPAIGAPKLAGIVEAVLSLGLFFTLLTGTTAGLLAVSTASWLAYHGGHRGTWPPLWDVLTIAATLPILVAVATPGRVFDGTITVPVGGRLLGLTGGAPTGVSLGLCGLASLVVLLVVSARRHSFRT